MYKPVGAPDNDVASPLQAVHRPAGDHPTSARTARPIMTLSLAAWPPRPAGLAPRSDVPIVGTRWTASAVTG